MEVVSASAAGAQRLDLRENVLQGPGVKHVGGHLELLQLAKDIRSDKFSWGQHEIRLQVQNRLDVRLGCADSRFSEGLRRVIAELGHPNHLLARTDREEDLRDARCQGDKTSRWLGQVDLPVQVIHERARGQVGHKRHPGQDALLSLFLHGDLFRAVCQSEARHQQVANSG